MTCSFLRDPIDKMWRRGEIANAGCDLTETAGRSHRVVADRI
jgi:hypothetical protein